MRRNAASPLARAATPLIPAWLMVALAALVLVSTLLAPMWMAARPASAQTPAPLIGYGERVAGELDSPQGAEYHFTGCPAETVSITLTADDFTPRLVLYGPDSAESLAAAVASRGERTLNLSQVSLLTAGEYVVVVRGRSRSDRGAFHLSVAGTGRDNPMPDDGGLALNLRYGDSVADTLAADGAGHWNFRGCAGDKILVEVDATGFVPQVELNFPIAEFPIATAEVDVAGDRAVATLVRALPANGAYNLIVSGASATDAGDYGLTLSRTGQTPHTPEATPAATPTSTPMPTPTAASGPRPRRGIPTPRSGSTPTPTTTSTTRPEPTPTFTPAPTQIPTQTSAPTVTSTVTPTPFLPPVRLEIFCTVITDRLNLRPGPGTNFNPPIDVLETGDLIVVVGRNAEGTWLQVAVLDVNLEVENMGWVSAEFVFCVGDIEDAPVVEVTP